MERSNGRLGLRILTTKKMLQLSELKLDLLTDHGFRLKLLHTRVKNSSNHHLLLLSPTMPPWDQEPLLEEETELLT